ncbi:hypothetical protein SADUNF_Sadunf06G0212200 [Salix dunnii]|uniref:Uncharacterized protein n=1 Tax=Salix dunnii TaxID=1413687 RepID=A0A835MY59_9ROSI|nr:hypothetical protein SADUNF_Sadunf06G0212200 [Salix dunnii]
MRRSTQLSRSRQNVVKNRSGSTSGSNLPAFKALTSVYFMQFLACNGHHQKYEIRDRSIELGTYDFVPAEFGNVHSVSEGILRFPVNYREICLGFHCLYQQDKLRPKTTDRRTQGVTSAPACIYRLQKPSKILHGKEGGMLEKITRQFNQILEKNNNQKCDIPYVL